jgi:DNA-binding NtrC family response regulator
MKGPPRLPKVLIVDDDPDIVSALMRNLHDEFELYSANDVDSALKVLETVRLDVIVSDEQMPGICGSELMAFARTRWPRVLRFIMTGKANPYSAQQAISAGQVHGYLEKPCPAEQLARRIREALLTRSLLSVKNRDYVGMSPTQASAILENLKAKREPHSD